MQLRTSGSLVRYAKLLRPRFSLRALMVAFTTFAIGFPTWYQWPYVESENLYRPWCCCVSGPMKPEGPPIGRIERTWRRQGFRWVMHGPWRKFNQAGELVASGLYHQDVEHGLYREFDRGRLVLEGHYDHGRRCGVWIYREYAGSFERRETMHRGLAQEMLISQNGQPIRRLTMEKYDLIAIDGKPIELPLINMPLIGDPEAIKVHNELISTTTMEFLETPLADAAEFLANQHNIPIRLSESVDRELPVTEWCHGIRLQEGLALMCQPRGLVCDFRSGAIWITTPEEKEAWNASRQAFAELVARAE